MARGRQAPTTTDEQMTLDDWAKVLKAGSETPRKPRRAAASSDSVSSTGVRANGDHDQTARATAERHHPSANELLETPGALLTRTHLRELGLERRAVDAVFRKLPVVALPGYARPMIHVEQYLELIRKSTYRDDRVRPSHA
jgi:hypothetical protein